MRSPSEFRIDVAPHGETSAILYPTEAAARTSARLTAGPSPSGSALILAHGAGAGQRSPFLIGFARAIAALGFDVVTFDFLYMERHRRMPDRAPVLEACYGAVITAVRDRVESARRSLFIGGKSMGGRIATQVAAADAGIRIDGLVLLGYPLHPPGRPNERRDAHLHSIRRPMLFVQGSRDVFGTPAELSPIIAKLRPAATLHVVEGGDHSFKVPRGGASAQAAVFEDVQRTVAGWMTALNGRSTPEPRRSA